ncbi:aminoacyl-tRNA hydrolase [Thermosulfurimonas marina]|uniref:Peptidyl-tRNA hydrolase n=1 Tax=Thermosulfurimonas marina TaxID=2047767 RepID=A0A6H1WU84_9BACT|nr:aminoacyl-tRNA hydrolase [Thermosulfurimonas marina]QJA06748.1 aminoacyl-tRNA hydrolase [Thermosulfurimonas marina]
MWLYAGLGNPGPKYARTRHNLGWIVLEALAEELGLSWREVPALKALVGEWPGRAWLLLPLTYMNLSGEAVAPALEHFAIPRERLLVIHDDLDLPLGRIKFAPKGGAGGHRGVLSVISAVGSEEFPRLKLGIGRPPAGVPVRDYVLSEFEPEEWARVERMVHLALAALKDLPEKGLLKVMSLYNRREAPQNKKGPQGVGEFL